LIVMRKVYHRIVCTSAQMQHAAAIRQKKATVRA
jgi:hypothetical protein